MKPVDLQIMLEFQESFYKKTRCFVTNSSLKLISFAFVVCKVTKLLFNKSSIQETEFIPYCNFNSLSPILLILVLVRLKKCSVVHYGKTELKCVTSDLNQALFSGLCIIGSVLIYSVNFRTLLKISRHENIIINYVWGF